MATPPEPERPRQSEDAARIAMSPPLLVGAPRSGTTWLQRMLLAHPQCCGGQESHFLASFAKVRHDFDRKRDLPRPHGLAAYLTGEELLEALRGVWIRTFAETIESKPSAKLLIEKTPDHAMHLGFAAELLPACRVIHLVRDSRAVAASLLRASREPWGRAWAPRTPAAAASRWLECVESAERSGSSLGSAAGSSPGSRLGSARFLRVHYEALHAAPASELARVLGFLGVSEPVAEAERIVAALDRAEYEEAGGGIVLRGELRDRPAREPSGFVGEGRIDGWKDTLGWRDERQVWSITRDAMTRLGYSRDGWERGPASA